MSKSERLFIEAVRLIRRGCDELVAPILTAIRSETSSPARPAAFAKRKAIVSESR